MNEEQNEQIQLNDVGYSLVQSNGQFKVLELTFDFEKGIIGTINVISSESEKAAAIERLKILIAEKLL